MFCGCLSPKVCLQPSYMPSPVVPSPKAAKAAAAAPSVTADFAAFIAATSSMVLPDAVKHATCRAFVNWIGCALGAANDDTLAPVYTVARGLSGREQASVVGTAERFDVVNAAMVNAVRAISIQVHPRAIELAGLRHPDTAIKGRFSLYHAAALALARRSAGLAAFEAADVHDVEFHALRELMTVTGDAQLQPSQARVQIELKDGSRLQSAIDHPSGSPQRPLTDPQLREKFSELAHRVLDEPAAETLFEACMSLDRLPDAGELHRHWNRAGSVA